MHDPSCKAPRYAAPIIIIAVVVAVLASAFIALQHPPLEHLAVRLVSGAAAVALLIQSGVLTLLGWRHWRAGRHWQAMAWTGVSVVQLLLAILALTSAFPVD